MRPVGIVLAVLLIAACPPRRSRVVYVQSVPIAPVVAAPAAEPVPQAPPPVAVDPVLDPHLRAWEEKVAGLTNLRAEVSLTRTDAVFKKTTMFGGSGSVVLWMKPNYVVFRINNSDDPAKTDYEAFICDGKSLYLYSGLAKTITAIKLPLNAEVNWPWNRLLTPNPALEVLSGMKAKEMKERFDIKLTKSDENYLYWDVKPRSDEDKRAFAHLRLALYGPGPNTAKLSYLPAQAYVLKPNGDTEVWKFTNPQIDLPGVEAKHFQFVDIKGWKVQQIPPTPPKTNADDVLEP
ncbi:Outer membrane lipoprotein carrier protein LolA OS=Isosphaera pallida (strain ATCC 43644 / DSM 9630 / IS1B) GN=Isop_0586 PE=4 SV=1 [Gemmata massiliana]|uniref:Outer membrane lipoprotein carrier protein LolA n=1 Tax=Gemmata massiliana TaxID=1210884 RepID=A0A6P2D584_9BACT|nr:TIGR03009 domain-containing protein [Gemmata massiliana]VTR95605.1 Outer membrane lipoprotein carrier protein LolA OS=Isosphaera pallida (strain ATCC 43644 / DSM 9630 / IS1B) GN=Isop_0586 PE=4 SV=1 [Gemmata massiliana]